MTATPGDEPSEERRTTADGASPGADDDEPPFWRQPETVEKFADRDPDHRLLELLDRWNDPSSTGVLDLGCAAGRNTVLLAREGFDVWALDTSPEMVERTRDGVAAILGREEAERRVLVGRMEDLGRFPDGRFALVVGLGVYHQAEDLAAYRRALAETARVLEPGGLVLVAVFGPSSRPGGTPFRRISGDEPVYEGFRSGRAHLLVDLDRLDREMARVGLRPEVPTEAVRVEMDEGFRVTINALYRKEADG